MAHPPPPPCFYTKLRSEGPKKIFFEAAPPSQGIDDRAPLSSPLSEGLHPPLSGALSTVSTYIDRTKSLLAC